MLDTRIKIYRNPWMKTLPNDELVKILQLVATKRAEHVEALFGRDLYKRNSLGLAILDPTAPVARQSEQTLLATFAIGPEGEDFVPNAIAKAVEHRDKGLLAGYGVYVDLTQTKDGDFCYGFSTQVDGTIAGASGQSEIQDACEAGHAAVTFNCLVREHRRAWLDNHPGHRWFSEENLPGELYSRMAGATAKVYDGGV